MKLKISNAGVLVAVLAALSMMLATHLVLRQVHLEGIREGGRQQQSALTLFWELAGSKGSDFRSQDGKLFIGEYLVNGNNELPDKVKRITGSSATIFLGDTRVATNVLREDGGSALGTKLTGPAYDAIYREGVPFRGETEILGSNYLTAYDPIRDSRGRIIGVLFVGTKEDDRSAARRRINVKIWAINGTLACVFVFFALLLLAERRRSEGATRKQLQFLQVIIDAIPSPVFYKDARGKYLGFNKVYESFVGRTREQMLGKTVHELWQKDLADKYRQMDQELFQNRGAQVYESRVRYADGSLHDVIFNKAAFYDEGGAVGGLVGVILDITERKAAEEETRNAYQKIADILEFLPDATFVVDREKRVIAWNRAIETLTGVPKAEMLGQGDQAYALPIYGVRRGMLIDMLDEERQVQQRRYPGIGRDGRTLSAEIKATPRGEERYLWAAAAPLFDRQGNKIGGIQTLRDISALRRAEQERGMLEAQLHTSGMMEALMIQLSHDLKTPLTPLFALLPMIRKKGSDPDIDRMLDICQSCVEQIKGLAGKAQDLVRLSSEALTPEHVPLPVPLAEAAELSAKRCGALFARRGVSCLNDIDARLTVPGVAQQLALLFDNLLSNAARYARENGTVRISAGQGEAGLTVKVQDDGVGLEPGHCNLIFGAFFKADAARHDLGTQGLGLAICSRIVSNHHGKIWAESPGKGMGTTILFTLGLPAAAPAVSLPEVRPPFPPGSEGKDGGTHHK